VDFAIWEREGAWFWFLINPRGRGGMIGAATNEAEVEREACLSIEEILTNSLLMVIFARERIALNNFMS
jgi:hypothetical protein